LGLSLDDDVLNQIMEVGFDPVYGARPLKRALQQLVENPLAEVILEGMFPPGSNVRGRLKDGEVVFLEDQR
jgi:ATP-dependent Clp protease ATP-binding subunit ClpB